MDGSTITMSFLPKYGLVTSAFFARSVPLDCGYYFNTNICLNFAHYFKEATQ